MFVSATWAQVKPLPTPQARKRMVQAVDKTLQEGPHAKLPPHLSTLLGLSQEQECPVRQGVVRTGKVVQGFDVSRRRRPRYRGRGGDPHRAAAPPCEGARLSRAAWGLARRARGSVALRRRP